MTGEQARTEVDVQALNRVREAHIAALNPDDVQAWVGVFSDDAVQMPPHYRANARLLEQ